jgi:predicted lipoprotein with Yx(FWY)xxD motif
VDRARRTTRPSHRVRGVWPVVVAVTVAGAVLGIAAKGSRPDGRESATEKHTRAVGPSVRVRRTKLGRILTDRHGRTLYLFLEDRRARSTCYGGCARVWPPAIATARPNAGPKVLPGMLTRTKRRNNTYQLVYEGHPLYRMDADVKPGDMKGEGFLGTWWVVSPSGHKIIAPGMHVARGGGY